MRQRLSDRALKALKAKSSRYDLMDTIVPGFGVRVTENGKRTFILIARYPGSTNPTRRSLGDYPKISLEEARAKAQHWHGLMARGTDPKDDEERQRREALRKKADSFIAVVEQYAKRVLSNQRSGRVIAQDLRTFFAEPWEGRSITSIERRDVLEIINKVIDRGATYQAHNLLGRVRALFNWALEQDYGLESSPCDRIKPKRLIGERKPRTRFLDDAEIKALWSATERMGYPFGPLYRLLLLTGCRPSEIAGARWQEISDVGVLTVPPERFKKDVPHLVPLAAEARAILKTLPTFTKNDYLFTSTFGAYPVSRFSDAKERLDALMAEELGRELPSFQTRDIRRTVRTRLAGLRVSDTVAEMVIGHGKKGLQRVYDQHKYITEMREAADLWAANLRDIVTPPPDNVRKLSRG